MNVRKITVLVLVCALLLPAAALAKEAKAEFKVTGMSCGGCAKGVEARLNDLTGVKAATVSYEDSSATVVYDDEKLTVETIKKTIEKSGFKAALMPKAKSQEKRKE